MKAYLFSIFVRGFTAINGFLVFLVTSRLFGAEGRGIISYGTSIFASIAIIVSFNLGRGFIVRTQKIEAARQKYLFSFLVINLLAIVITAICGAIFIWISKSADNILTSDLVLPLVLTSIIYVWSINGNPIFASFERTLVQDRVILVTRIALTVYLGSLMLVDTPKLGTFLWWYAGILSAGVGFEWFLLRKKISSWRTDWSTALSSVQHSAWPHLDYICFHLFPVALILIAGLYLEKQHLGRINFAIQIISLIFLLSTTASIRINTYISTVGFRQRLKNIKRLLYTTLAVSVLAAVLLIPLIRLLTGLQSFASFEGSDQLFTIAIFAIPGFIAYQFFMPLWLEDNLIKRSALLNIANVAIITLVTPFLISAFGERGVMYCFSLFYTGCLIVHLYLFRIMRRQQISKAQADASLSSGI